jgi:hypothetical protein
VGVPIGLPSAPRAIASGAGHLWVACGPRKRKECTLERVDPGTGEVKRWADSDWNIYDIAVDGERLLVAAGLALAGPAAGMGDVGAIGGAPAHHGGGHGGVHSGGQ